MYLTRHASIATGAGRETRIGHAPYLDSTAAGVSFSAQRSVKGAWLVARRVIPPMIARKSGVIVNNSSVAGLRGMARLSHSAASKWGLVGLTKSWAIELAPYGIRVVSIRPTGVNTRCTTAWRRWRG
ncbi:MAG: SDR family NAD(P)-dependent oxidoreductase [Planctomycetaceae bacterium]|nr:SDR family NAD(P)-dependent oxidoreductase [Planctomycetaceae bacterium]